MANEINREHKSTLFTYMLSEKKYALQVYNALNNSHYDNPEEITITTLENVVFINRYNDVSYMFNSTLQLYEHQSTYNPNMPLRSLFYLANTYEKMIKKHEKYIYSSKLITIPTPKFVVFYNGENNQPDRQILKLSDAFANKDITGDVEITVLMLNINHNHNKDLMEKCEILKGYSIYIEKFREYNKDENLNEVEAATNALDYCINHNIMADFFKERRNEVVGMILEEYTEEHVERYLTKLEKELAAKDQELEAHKCKIETQKYRLQAQQEEIESQQEEIELLKKLLKDNDVNITLSELSNVNTVTP